MPTMSLELNATFNESLARRNVGSRFYAGIPSTGYTDQVVSVAGGATVTVAPSPTGSFQAVIVAADVGTSIKFGWTLSAVTTEIAVNLLSVVTPPSGATYYVRNAAASNTPVVPVRLTCVY